MSDDDSSGPFNPASAKLPAALEGVEAKTVSSRFFKGVQVSVPWTCVLGMMLTGVYYVFVVERDANFQRDYRIKAVEESVIEVKGEVRERADHIEQWLQWIGQNMQQPPPQHSVITRGTSPHN